MKPIRLFHLLAITALLLAALPGAPAQAAARSQAQPPEPALFVPGEILVTLAPSVGSDPAGAGAVRALAGQVGGQLVARAGSLALLSVDESADVQSMAARLQNQGQVLFAQPNYIYSVPETPQTRSRAAGADEPARLQAANHAVTVTAKNGAARTLTRAQLSSMRTLQRRGNTSVNMSTFPSEYTNELTPTWGWERVGGQIVWQDSKTAAGVCLLDTGVDYKHKDLSGRIINGYDFVNDDSTPNDDNGHGTSVAGVIAALPNNGASTAIGVSNGKVVAVKVLNAQGIGTSYAIAAGLYYCAARSDVKVINMSLGSSAADRIEYDALYDAIVTRGKLVVAAAGNGYSSAPIYPAAWASADTPAPAGALEAPINKIAVGLVSVAAARVNPPTYPIWVDVNGNDQWDQGESFQDADCALASSSYGNTITLVAPGHLIWSTTPTSYPFFGNYYYGDRAGYEYSNGTSLAAPFVAGGAARLLAARPELSNKSAPATTKQWLVDHSFNLTLAVDTNPNRPDFDPANAWAYPDYHSGQAQLLKDPTGADVMAIKAPFCWPNASDPYTAAQDMSAARYFNLAAVMQRYGVYGEMYDASTGGPLNGATVRSLYQALNAKYSVIKDSAVISSKLPYGSYYLLNIPAVNSGATYYLQVSKSGYTSGYQTFGWFFPDAAYAGKLGSELTSFAAVPPARDITAVVNWYWGSNHELDLHAWLPGNAPEPVRGYVSPDYLKAYLPAYTAFGSLGYGALIAPRSPLMPPSPFAQLMHNGGGALSNDTLAPFDSISIRTKGSTSAPYYSGGAITDTYKFYITDYSKVYPNQVAEYGFPYPNALNIGDSEAHYDPNFVYPVLRVWVRGTLPFKNIIELSRAYFLSYTDEKNYTINPACTSANDWWHPADYGAKGLILTPIDQACGTGENYLPQPLP